MSHDPIQLVTLSHPQAATTIPSLRSLALTPSLSRTSNGRPLEQDAVRDEEAGVSKMTIASVIGSVTMVAGLNSMVNGIIGVALPTIAWDLGLSDELLLWPAAITSLTCGCTFLISGSLVDVFGSRVMYLLGCSLQCLFVLGCGLSKTAVHLLVFLGLTGIAVSFCLPSAVSIITNTLPTGKPRNLAFGLMGSSQPAGFALGFVLGGLLSETIGWRYGFFISAATNAITVVVAGFGLPKDTRPSIPTSWQRRWDMVRQDIDWVGALISSTSLALMSYMLASVSGSSTNIREPINATLLAIALALVPAFIFWVDRQERNSKPALIPNSLWRDRGFTSICIAVFLVWGTLNGGEIIMSFFFQDVQLLTPIQTSLRFIPNFVAGVLVNVINGLVVHRLHANWIIVIALAVTSLGSVLMAVCNPQWSYWACSFLANCFLPAGVDTLFTVASLLITSVFPAKTQGLAGGVFNTVSQIGRAVGVALSQVIATSITAHSRYTNKSSPPARLEGYHASYWYCFAVNVTTLLIAVWGLRSIGKVGHKRD